MKWKWAKTLFAVVVVASSTSAVVLADACPADCPVPPDPTGLGCSIGLRNCIGSCGNATVLSQVRGSVAGVYPGSCDSCGQKGKGNVTVGPGKTTYSTAWSINLPYGIGTVSGGSAQDTVTLTGTINCIDCQSISVPYYVYNDTVTIQVPYTLTQKVGFPNTYCWWPFSYTLVTAACPNTYTATTTYTVPEGALGATTTNSCPPCTGPPCCNPI